MNIGILNWRDLRNSRSGGAELTLHEIGKRWASAGHRVVLVSSEIDGEAPSGSDEGLEICRIGALQRGSHHLLAPHRTRGMDVVLESINTLPYWMPLRRRVPPFVPVVHQMAKEVWSAHLPDLPAHLLARLEPNLYRPYRTVPCLAFSESTRTDLLRAGVCEVSVVRQGGGGRRTTQPKESEPTLVWAGRFVANKRPADAMRAFGRVRSRYPTARLWMIGDGELRKSLETEAGAGVELLGRLPYEEVLERMGRAHVLMVTSVKEGWGLVVTEANSMGTPAVGYDVAGLCDSIRHGRTGSLVQPNPVALGDEVVRILEDRERYSELCTHALKWSERFTWDALADDLLGRLERAALLTPG